MTPGVPTFARAADLVDPSLVEGNMISGGGGEISLSENASMVEEFQSRVDTALGPHTLPEERAAVLLVVAERRAKPRDGDHPGSAREPYFYHTGTRV